MELIVNFLTFDEQNRRIERKFGKFRRRRRIVDRYTIRLCVYIHQWRNQNLYKVREDPSKNHLDINIKKCLILIQTIAFILISTSLKLFRNVFIQL